MGLNVEKDHSVLGRERNLSRTFFKYHAFDTAADFSFARQTLLQRVIMQFKPDNTYCHLDGFDMDVIQRSPHGFIAGGRFWHLSEPGTPGDIPIIMAVEFNISNREVKRARIWISPKSPTNVGPIKVRFSKLEDAFSNKKDIGSDWQHAFYRKSDGWFKDDNFDLSIVLMPQN